MLLPSRVHSSIPLMTTNAFRSLSQAAKVITCDQLDRRLHQSGIISLSAMFTMKEGVQTKTERS
eukprot:6072575-Amphidinium_carterae.2